VAAEHRRALVSHRFFDQLVTHASLAEPRCVRATQIVRRALGDTESIACLFQSLVRVRDRPAREHRVHPTRVVEREAKQGLLRRQRCGREAVTRGSLGAANANAHGIVAHVAPLRPRPRRILSARCERERDARGVVTPRGRTRCEPVHDLPGFVGRKPALARFRKRIQLGDHLRWVRVEVVAFVCELERGSQNRVELLADSFRGAFRAPRSDVAEQRRVRDVGCAFRQQTHQRFRVVRDEPEGPFSSSSRLASGVVVIEQRLRRVVPRSALRRRRRQLRFDATKQGIALGLGTALAPGAIRLDDLLGARDVALQEGAKVVGPGARNMGIEAVRPGYVPPRECRGPQRNDVLAVSLSPI
jgi:hypothetical protein